MTTNQNAEVGTQNKRVTDLTDERFREIAMANHIWLNGFSCIRPSEAFLADVGREVLRILRQSDLRDSLGISQYAVLTINKS